MRLLSLIIAIYLFNSIIYAGEIKRVLNNNMTLKTNVLPNNVDNLSDAFSNGVFYGRIRMDSFRYDYKELDRDNYAFGLGGSLIYKSAPFLGLSTTIGFYYSDSPFSFLHMSNKDVGIIKSGKDTFSRKKVRDDGDWSIAVLAQLNLQYKYSNTTLKVGRQIFESFLTKSNDTKMIPNTFNGYTLVIKEIPKTTIRVAYFTAQKLRDHTTFHDVITFKDSSGDVWANNDDSAVHKGLSYVNFKMAGKNTNHELIITDISNVSVKNLKINLTYGIVPDVVSSITSELNYKIALPSNATITPGIRYMQQIDNGGGKIGGANLKGNFGLDKGVTINNLGYNGVHSLNSNIWMARLVLNKGPIKAKIAYSAVANESDIVAPWRGFPTGGYTRAMAQYNWYANTKTTDFEINYDFDKAGLISGFSSMVRYAMQNFDEAKQGAGIQADSNIMQIDLREHLTQNLYVKLRVGLVNAKRMSPNAGVNAGKDLNSYREYRFGLNYLF